MEDPRLLRLWTLRPTYAFGQQPKINSARPRRFGEIWQLYRASGSAHATASPPEYCPVAPGRVAHQLGARALEVAMWQRIVAAERASRVLKRPARARACGRPPRL